MFLEYVKCMSKNIADDESTIKFLIHLNKLGSYLL